MELVDGDYPNTNCLNQQFDCLVTGVFDNYMEKINDWTAIRHVFMLATDTSDFDEKILQKNDVKLDSGSGYCANSVAELSIAMAILLNRNFINNREIHRGITFGRDLQDSTLGVLGAGRIGSCIARKALSLGLNTLASGRTNKLIDNLPVKNVGIEGLFRESEIISINIPLTSETKNMLNGKLPRVRQLEK